MSDFANAHEVRACRGCLALRCKLYDIRENRLVQVFSDLTGLQVSGGLLCSTCLHLVKKFNIFRVRCRYSGHILNHMLSLNEDTLSSVDRSNLRFPLCRSNMWHIDCKAKRELSLTDVQHIIIPNEATDFKNDVKTEVSSVENLSDSESIHMVDIGVSDVEIKTVIEDSTDTNELTDEFPNKIEDFIEKYEILDNTDVDVIETNIDDADDNVEESIIDDTDKVVLESNMDYTDNSLLEPVLVKRVASTESKIKKNKKKLAVCFANIENYICKVNGDCYEMFERLYKFSLVKERPEIESNLNINKKQTRSEQHMLMKFLDLYKEIADTCKVNVEFISVMEERRAMDEVRKTLAIGSEQYNCVKCRKICNSSGALDRHIELAHNEDLPNRCEVCFYTFKRNSSLVMHVFKFHCTRRKCRECDKTIVSNCLTNLWSEVDVHDMYHRGRGITTCQFCGRTFIGSKRCSNHIRKMHLQVQMNAVQCWLCGYSFNGPLELNSHVRKIHTEAVKCATCGVFFRNEEAMAAHFTEIGACTKDTSACPMCGATFPTESPMKKHYDILHAKYKCKKCARSFIKYDCYKVHLDQICSANRQNLNTQKEEAILKKYTRNAELTAENQTNKVCEFVCHVCGKVDKKPLIDWMLRKYTIERPFKCEQCDVKRANKNKTKAKIIDLHKNGLNISKISKETGLSSKTVKLCIARHDNESNNDSKGRKGRPWKISTAQRRSMVNEYQQNGPIATKLFAKKFNTSIRTIRRALHAEGILYRRTINKLQLTPRHKQERLRFAQDYLDFDWENAVFSDEKTFLSCHEGKLRWWRQNITRSSTESDRITVNMWGWMSAEGPGELEFKPTRAPEDYVEVLDEVMLPSVRNVYPSDDFKNITLVQDNCPVHRSGIVRDWFKQHPDIKVIPWPARSPDLNPMENIWSLMVQRWEAREERRPLLQSHCMEVWESIRGSDICANLVGSMRGRLLACIEKKGGHTKF